MTGAGTIRVGGVPEHFNLPWRLAIEDGDFTQRGLDVSWIDFPGGTGAIMAALDAGEIDLATPLTEGAITAIANGSPTELVHPWVDSPLLWGVHVAGQSSAEEIADVEGQRFAISRLGSGSELMSRVMAEDLDWELTEASFVTVGNIDGALTALPAGDAEVFLWNLSMTQPHVTDGTFKRIGVVPTPWPSFTVAATKKFLTERPGVAATVSEMAASRAALLSIDDSAAAFVAQRYGLDMQSALDWASHVEFAAPGAPVDTEMVAEVRDRMVRLGRIQGG